MAAHSFHNSTEEASACTTWPKPNWIIKASAKMLHIAALSFEMGSAIFLLAG